MNISAATDVFLFSLYDPSQYPHPSPWTLASLPLRPTLVVDIQDSGSPESETGLNVLFPCTGWTQLSTKHCIQAVFCDCQYIE